MSEGRVVKRADQHGAPMVLSAGLNRRSLLAISIASIARPAFAALPDGLFQIGVLVAAMPVQPWLTAFLGKLEELGYTNGKNLRLEVRAAGGHFDYLPALAAELIALRTNVIVATSTPSLMGLYKANCPIPVVFNSGLDPAKLGIAVSISHPGGNYTGIVNTAGEISSKRLQILRDLLPSASRVAYFVNPANNSAAAISAIEATSAAASHVGLEIACVEVTSADELSQAFAEAAKRKADSLLGTPDPLFFSSRQQIIALAREHRLPAIYNFRIEATDGGLIAYGADVESQYRTMAIYVDKILRGERPGDLPIEQASKLALIINMKTAKELGLTVPPLLFAQADDVIE